MPTFVKMLIFLFLSWSWTAFRKASVKRFVKYLHHTLCGFRVFVWIWLKTSINLNISRELPIKRKWSKLHPLNNGIWLWNILYLNSQVAMYYIKKHKSEHKSHKINKSPEVRRKEKLYSSQRDSKKNLHQTSFMHEPLAFEWHFRWWEYVNTLPYVCVFLVQSTNNTNLQFICNNKNHLSPPKRITQTYLPPQLYQSVSSRIRNST